MKGYDGIVINTHRFKRTLGIWHVMVKTWTVTRLFINCYDPLDDTSQYELRFMV